MRNAIGTLTLALALSATPAMAQQAKPDTSHKHAAKPATVAPATAAPSTAAPSTTAKPADQPAKPKRHHAKKKPDATKPTS